MGRLLLAVLLTLAAGACSTPQTDFLRHHPDAVPERGAVARPVFFAQRTKECGPAALAMVLAQSGVAVGRDDLVGEVYNPGREGSLTPAILAAARRHGRIAYPVKGLTSLLGEVASGRPVLVLLNLALSWFPIWHYAVAVGYDLAQDTITLHSGTTPFLSMPLETFEHTWTRAGGWAIVVLRPGEFPVKPDETLYLKAVAGVERAGRARVAAESYAAAAKRWPDSLIALMGLGNARYKLGERRAAAAAFRQASRRHPDSAAAFNNYAQVLSELGKLDAAERAARTAVSLDRTGDATYRATLREILAAREKAREGDSAPTNR